MPRKKYAEIRAKKAHNTTLQKLFQEKLLQKFEPKKHLTLPYKNYAKKIKMHKFEPKQHLTLPYKNYARRKKK